MKLSKCNQQQQKNNTKIFDNNMSEEETASNQSHSNRDSDKLSPTEAAVAIEMDGKDSDSTAPEQLRSSASNQANGNILTVSGGHKNVNAENDEEEAPANIPQFSIMATPGEWINEEACSEELSRYIRRFETFERAIGSLKRYGDCSRLADSLERGWKRQMGAEDFQILESFFDYAQKYVGSM